MAVYDRENLNPGAWFDYDENVKLSEDGPVFTSRLKLRAASMEVIEEIRVKCQKRETLFKQARKHGPLMPVEKNETDEKEMRRLLWDYCLMEWENFFWADGEAIECNIDNKYMLLNGNPALFDFVDDKIALLSGLAEKDQEALEKN